MTTLLTNVTSSRHRPPSLVPPRKEGWTEIWGTSNSNGGDDDGSSPTARYATILNDDCDVINVNHHRTPSRSASSRNYNDQRRTSRPPSSSSPMILTQHRVAWHEQVVLRMTYQPHSVRNSKYSVMESTGPLPYLLDMSPSMSPSTASGGIDNDNPALIGANQPGGMGSRFFQQMNSKSSSSSSNSNNNNNNGNDNYAATTETTNTFMSSGSHIVDYLQSKCHPLPPPPPGVLRGHTMAYETLIRDRLDYILLALRYGHSPTWTSMYRNQCIRASLDHTHEMTAATDAGMREYGNTAPMRRGYFVFPFWSWYQTHVERKVAMSNILPTIYDNTTLSTRSGLSLELFRYNDHRDGAITKNDDDDKDKDEEEAIHQHHPFSSYLSNYSGSGGGDACGVNFHRAMELADSYYSSLECALIVASTPPTTNENQSEENDHKKEEQHQQCTYLFGAIQPTHLDALLFAHLAEAMCDVHLVLVLSKHVKLIKYFDLLYNTYFGNGYITLYKSRVPSNENIDDDVDWISQNNKVNANNAFNRLPEIIDASNDNSNIYNNDNNDDDVVRAIRLIQHLAIHCSSNNNDNKDVITAALCNDSSMAGRKEAGENEHAVLQSYRQPTCPNLYRWIMGGEFRHQPALSRSEGSRANVDNNNNDDDASISGDDDKEEKEREQSSSSSSPSHARKEDDDKKRKLVTKMKREQSVHDELWLSGVGSVLLLALIISTSRKS